MAGRRKAVLGTAARTFLSILQRFADRFPFFDQRGVGRLVLLQLLRLPLGFFRAHEILQRRFQVRDLSFGAVDCFFQLVDAIFHLLALKRIQALLGGFVAVAVPTSRNVGEKWGIPSLHRR